MKAVIIFFGMSALLSVELILGIKGIVNPGYCELAIIATIIVGGVIVNIALCRQNDAEHKELDKIKLTEDEFLEYYPEQIKSWIHDTEDNRSFNEVYEDFKAKGANHA